VRAGLVVACIASAGIAEARPRLEASAFAGIDWFGAHTSLGNSWAPEQVPGTSPLVGARATWLALPDLPRDLQLGAEAELAFAPASTGGTIAGRRAYFAPVFAWRAHAVLRLARWRELAPHLVLGGGGATVASASPFMSRESDPVVYWGAGAIAPIAARWHVRLDLRHGLMPAREGGLTSTLEVHLGFGATFGGGAPVVVKPAVAIDRDRDGDGLVDRLDACPDEPEDRNGVADDDGCPEPDPDGDGLVGAADRCPDEPEDVDGWQDDDGCPDLDNDGDGLADQVDGCPNEAETVNGWQDDDGCPDQLPAALTAALATPVRFEPGRARVTPAARAALRPLLAQLLAQPALRIAIASHGGDDLARRRAEAVKWHLIDQGVAEDRIVTRAGAPGPAAITFALAQ
jgi:OOP family OmpA-OmpF porin